MKVTNISSTSSAHLNAKNKTQKIEILDHENNTCDSKMIGLRYDLF